MKNPHLIINQEYPRGSEILDGNEKPGGDSCRFGYNEGGIRDVVRVRETLNNRKYNA